MLNEWSDRSSQPPRMSGPRRFLLAGVVTLIMLAIAIGVAGALL